MFVMAYEPYVKNDTNAHVTISSWRRIDDNVIPARGKVAGAYANSALIKTDANRAGFDEALVLDNNGHVSEGSAMNIFMVRDGVLVTPPVTDNILEGITRRSIIEIARKELGLKWWNARLTARSFHRGRDVHDGNRRAGGGVTKVDHRPVGSGVMGPVTTKLRLRSMILCARRIPNMHWNVEVK
jgi:branched-chain amino acid aminotransferase